MNQINGFKLFFSTFLLLLPICGFSQSTSNAQRAGLHLAHDPLDLKSSVALVADADSQQVLFAKNPHVILPIASITKLMTVMVNLEAQVNLDEMVTITSQDIDTYKNTHSRLKPGTTFTRRELMHLALMASENRAASALGRTFPGGMVACVERMNAKARQLNMSSTHFVESTGLSEENKSSANDLAHMIMHAQKFPLIRNFSTDPEFSVNTQTGPLNFKNTNRLVTRKDWDIQVQKTGFINEAGRCLVMQARVAGKNLVIVLLDSVGKQSRFADADRIRQFIDSSRYVTAELQR